MALYYIKFGIKYDINAKISQRYILTENKA